MKWLLILLCIIGFYSNIGPHSNSYDQDKEVYYGTWKGESQWIITEVKFEEEGVVEVKFSQINTSKYIERTGIWQVKEKMVQLSLNYEETPDYSLNIKNVGKWYKHTFTIIGKNKGILIDDNASTYIVYKVRDKKGKRIKRLKKRI